MQQTVLDAKASAAINGGATIVDLSKDPRPGGTPP